MLLVRLGTHYEDPKQGEIGLLVTFFSPLKKNKMISASILPAPCPEMSRGMRNSQIHSCWGLEMITGRPQLLIPALRGK